MKLSLNWIKEFTAVDIPVDELVKKIGAQLGEVENVESLGEKYRGVVIAKVISCDKHPNADRLSVCTIDDGGVVKDVTRDEHGHVQVVCGAPNVREGLFVAWLPPGSTVPESFDKDPFVLSARDLRGVVSNGMLASPKELSLSDNHEGILELEDDKPAGQSFAEAYGLDDTIIEIENKMFTHRPDLFGELGLAREIAGIQGRQFTSPGWYQTSLEDKTGSAEQKLPLKIANELPSLVPRFMAAALKDVTIKPSPVWLQSKLARAGLRPINNVVDITNYMMILTGQPLHAYDYDKVAALSEGDGATIVVRNPRDNERLALLNGKTINPRSQAIMIATNKELIGVGGVMGGADTEVDATTKNIILEVASFDMYSIRRTSMAHGLFTDAVTRFNKGQSPLQNDKVFGEALRLLSELSGAQLDSDIIDDNHVEGRAWVHPPVPVTTAFINERLGLTLSSDEMKTLLENVEFAVALEGDKLTVTAPFWRTDIETREDIVEEVGRLYGFDALPKVLPGRSIQPVTKNSLLELKSRVRENLAKSGANELLTYSFVHGNLLQKAGQDPAQAFRVSNALSPNLQYYRLSLTPSLLEKVHPNIKAGYDEFVLFEIGRAHNLKHQDTDNDLPTEFEMLDVVFAATDKAAKPGAAFYQARKYLVNLAKSFGIELEFRPFEAEEEYAVARPYDHTRSAKVFVKGTEIPLGMVGEYKASVRNNLKLPKYCAGFGIGLLQLQQALDATPNSYVPLSRFPKVEQDVTLRVAKDIHAADLQDFVLEQLTDHKQDSSDVRLETLSIYASRGDTAFKNLTYRVRLVNYERTMKAEELSGLLDTAVAAAHDTFAAERI
jgi:phenylalanyl-tRNA synthetase beta chain